MTMPQDQLNEIVRLHKLWIIKDPEGKKANLSGSNPDYSCWGFSCKTNHVKVCAKIAAQLAAHFCVLECDDPAYEKARKALLPFARKSHRAVHLGLTKEKVHK